MITALSLEHDNRIGGFCITARASYGWFLNATEGSEANLKIQRQIIKGSKAYATLRADLRRGCVLPPLVLSAQDEGFQLWLERTQQSGQEPGEYSELTELQPLLAGLQPSELQIIDGLQRTNALRQINEELEGEEREIFVRRRLRLEVWMNLPFNAIAYRMLLLNAGQKPMSMKHQVEILSMNLRDDLASIPELDIIIASDNRRRYRPGQFQLVRLSQAFQAWLQGAPNIDVSNTVMQELLADSAIETLGSSLSTGGETGDAFRRLVEWIVKADYRVCEENVENLQFFASDTVLQGLSAAVGFMNRNPSLSDTVWDALQSLISNSGPDPLGITQFNAIREGFNPGRRNVGVATRELVFNAFQQYCLGRGIMPIESCWLLAGSASKA